MSTPTPYDVAASPPATAPTLDVLPHRALQAPRTSVAGRAALCLALLVGYFAACAGVIALLAHLTVQALLLRGGGFLGSKLAILTCVVGLAITRAVLAVERRSGGDEDGVLVSRADEPDLWALVDDVARELDVPAPDDLRLVDDVDAFVHQDTRLLGLVGGRRHLGLGVGLLQALTVDQLRGVIGHELGHYAGGETRLAPLVYRARQTLVRTTENLGSRSLIGRLFGAYEGLYQRVSLAVCRRQELRADSGAVRVVGRATHALGLARVRAAARAWSFYVDSYVVPLWQSGTAPADLYIGFRAFLDDDVRREQLQEIAVAVDGEAADPYDSHPSPAERLAAMQRVPDRPPPGDIRPARTLLREVQNLERRLTDTVSSRVLALLPAERYDLSGPLDPEPYVSGFAHDLAALSEATAAVDGQGQPAGVGRALTLLEAGRGDELVTALTGDRRRLPDAARAERLRALVTGPLAVASACALAGTGRAHWAASWARPVRLVGPVGEDVSLSTRLEQALDADGAGALRSLLTEFGVPLEDIRLPVQVPRQCGERQPVAAATGDYAGAGEGPLGDVLAVWPGLARGRARFDGYVTTDLLVLVRQPRTWRDDIARALSEVYRVGSGRVREAAHARVRCVLATPLRDLQASPGAIVLRWDDLRSVRLTGHWDKAWVLRIGGQPKPCDRLLAEDDGLAGDVRSTAQLLRRLVGDRLDSKH